MIANVYFDPKTKEITVSLRADNPTELALFNALSDLRPKLEWVDGAEKQTFGSVAIKTRLKLK